MLKNILSFFIPRTTGKMENDNQRLGMYKNFRVGLIKYFQRGVNGTPSTFLAEVVESCLGTSGKYFATYNLHVEVDRRFAENIDMSCVGKWVLFGFYIQSFRSGNGFSTVLRLRHFEEIDSDGSATIEVLDHRIKDDNQTRSIIMPDVAFGLMKEISDKTKFNEYGKR